MSKAIQINNGQAVVTEDGRVVVVDTDDSAQGCCCEGGNPPLVCGTDEGCGFYCFPDKEQVSLSSLCKCPCAGSVWYPPGFTTKWSGPTIDMSSHFTFALPNASAAEIAASDYFIFSSVPDLSWNSCTGFTANGQRVNAPDGVIDVYASDGTFKQSQSIEFGFTFSGAGIPLVASPPCITFEFSSTPGPGIAALITPVLNCTNLCLGGRIIPINRPQLYDNGPPLTPFIDPGVFTLTPVCRDCSGNLIDIGIDPGTAPKQGFCSTILGVEFSIGLTNYFVEVSGSSANRSWAGEEMDGSFARIEAVTPNCMNCCPSGTPGEFNACWKITYGVGECFNILYTTGSCPTGGDWEPIACDPTTPPDGCDISVPIVEAICP